MDFYWTWQRVLSQTGEALHEPTGIRLIQEANGSITLASPDQPSKNMSVERLGKTGLALMDILGERIGEEQVSDGWIAI